MSKMIPLHIELFRLVCASVVGMVMGIERSKRKKSAGVGTFTIMCITSCLLTLISVYGFKQGNADPSRLISNIITAIGFVAGGVIFTVDSNKKIKVNGLTTGAEIFCVASLGIGIGLGFYEIVIAALILVQVNIELAMKINLYYKRKDKEKSNKIDLKEEEDKSSDLDI